MNRHEEIIRHCRVCGESFKHATLENLCMPCGNAFADLMQLRQGVGFSCAPGMCLDCDDIRRKMKDRLALLAQRATAPRIIAAPAIHLAAGGNGGKS